MLEKKIVAHRTRALHKGYVVITCLAIFGIGSAPFAMHNGTMELEGIGDK